MMKKIMLIAIAVLSMMACKKNTVTPDVTVPASNKEFVGEWTWVRSSGGITGAVTTPENGTQLTYTFTDNTLSVDENGQKLGKTTFTTYKGKSLTLNVAAAFMKADIAACPNCKLAEAQMYAFAKTQDTLFLSQDVFDGIQRTFVKKRTDGFVAATFLGKDPTLCAPPCCGGLLFNINGLIYKVNELPSGFTFDQKKVPQKLLLKIQPTTISCARVVKVTEAKVL